MVGDSHGNLDYLQQVIQYGIDEGDVDEIIQLGDFGYWEHTVGGVRFLDQLNEILIEHELKLHWVDGNHENHAMLRAKYKPHGLTPIRSNIVYIPRGTRWEWDGVTFLGIGGAYSIDKRSRLADTAEAVRFNHMSENPYPDHVFDSWWPEELITLEEVELACEGGHVDVVVSHDSPSCADTFEAYFTRTGSRLRPIPETTQNQWRLQDVYNATLPKRWYHGHYHFPYRTKVGECIIEGLSCDGTRGSITILDTEDLHV